MNKYYCVRICGESMAIRILEAKKASEWVGNAAAHSFSAKEINVSFIGKTVGENEIIKVIKTMEDFPALFPLERGYKSKNLMGEEVVGEYFYEGGSFIFYGEYGGKFVQIPPKIAWGEQSATGW